MGRGAGGKNGAPRKERADAGDKSCGVGGAIKKRMLPDLERWDKKSAAFQTRSTPEKGL